MTLTVVATGRLREAALRSLADDYLARIRRYHRCQEIEVSEARDLARAVPPQARMVALDPGGELVTSPEFAARLERWLSTGKGQVAFLLGGAEGILPELLLRVDSRLSLSRLTMPHRLARVVLYEQIYRAFTILRGEPYAREG